MLVRKEPQVIEAFLSPIRLSAMETKQRLAALQCCNKKGQSVWHAAAEYPDFLRELTKFIPIETYQQAILASDKDKPNLLYLTADKPDSLAILLEQLTVAQFEQALGQEHGAEIVLRSFKDVRCAQSFRQKARALLIIKYFMHMIRKAIIPFT